MCKYCHITRIVQSSHYTDADGNTMPLQGTGPSLEDKLDHSEFVLNTPALHNNVTITTLKKLQ